MTVRPFRPARAVDLLGGSVDPLSIDIIVVPHPEHSETFFGPKPHLDDVLVVVVM